LNTKTIKMDHTKQPLIHNKFFHIYNRGINGCDIFNNNKDYELFLNKYSEYIEPVAQTYAWCLMKNHFHVVVKINAEDEIQIIKPKEGETRKFTSNKKYDPTRQFSHLFNAYARNFNVRNNRTGSLFETSFKRILVDEEQYFKHLIYYIHYNPVKHGFTGKMFDYPWSSYLTTIAIKPTKLQRDKIIGRFNSKSEFINFHESKHDEEIFKVFDLDE